RDEERVQRQKAQEGQHFEEKGHAPLSGARVLGGSSSSTRISRRSISFRRSERTYVLSSGRARRIPGGAVQGRAQPRQGDALRLVAQSLHGLRPPVHVLLRPGVRAPGGP